MWKKQEKSRKKAGKKQEKSRNFLAISGTDSRALFFENWFLSVGLLGVFIALILIDGVIILILHSGRYQFN